MSTEQKRAFGRRLRQRRLELAGEDGRPMSQQELASRVSAPAQYISNWERGVHWPSDQYLEKLAKVLEVNSEYFRDAVRAATPPSRLSQLDRLERKVELLLDYLGVDWAGEISRAAAPTLEVFEGEAETRPQADEPPADTPQPGSSEPAPGRTRPPRAGSGPS